MGRKLALSLELGPSARLSQPLLLPEPMSWTLACKIKLKFKGSREEKFHHEKHPEWAPTLEKPRSKHPSDQEDGQLPNPEVCKPTVNLPQNREIETIMKQHDLSVRLKRNRRDNIQCLERRGST